VVNDNYDIQIFDQSSDSLLNKISFIFLMGEVSQKNEYENGFWIIYLINSIMSVILSIGAYYAHFRV